MSARRSAARIAALTLTPLGMAAYAALPASAHGSMTDPVSRVAACYAEGPENPSSAACKAAIAASGKQAFYDWNAVNIPDAGGRSRQIVPDGQLCSAGNPTFKGLDLPRGDWPASSMTSGQRTFHYKGTAPHAGGFQLYITKDGYDPTKPLKWSDLEDKPFASVNSPEMQGQDYVFTGTVPQRTGRHLIYAIWQRSDSPEAFYSCSDVVFGADGGSTTGGGTGTTGGSGATGGSGTSGGAGTTAGSGSSEPTGGTPNSTPSKPGKPDRPGRDRWDRIGTPDCPYAKSPTDGQIAQGARMSSVEHAGHGDEDPRTNAASSTDGVRPNGGSTPLDGENLAETGSTGATPLIALTGTVILALGVTSRIVIARRRRSS
ncbi:lytic polysaccharide monooxygenase [Streptomyces sp. G1]|uniref:lytic polysaccharide monooxygenase auxiliary activity family 9 protein n=1 Tax=Streptomyces sp. G1 TaxID=361572 RepID=UPI00202E2B20|nr:lytic polysaccharide monooxygenase [Streptomyces sp. G1]MCM1965113.1 lytic polysaccharide monooxygenase [Streptomyces sp. G1]